MEPLARRVIAIPPSKPKLSPNAKAKGKGKPKRAALPGVPEINAMRIATRCTTVAQFVATFHPYCDATTCFVPTTSMRPRGYEAAFLIQLADGTPLLRGVCAVLDAWPHADHRFERPGVLLQLRRLTNDSKPVYERLLAARSIPIEIPGDETIPSAAPEDVALAALCALPLEAADSKTATAAMPPIEFYAPEPAHSVTPTVAMQPIELRLRALTEDERSAGAAGTVDCTVSDEPTIPMAMPPIGAAAVGPFVDALRRTLLGVMPFARVPPRAPDDCTPPAPPPRHHRHQRISSPALIYPAALAEMRATPVLRIALVVGIVGILILLMTLPR